MDRHPHSSLGGKVVGEITPSPKKKKQREIRRDFKKR
jgi:hypothetical protein